MATITEFRPVSKKQEMFLSSPADVVGGGGAAGGGKTTVMLADPTRYVENPRFSAILFRRTYPQITAEGALWDSAVELYPGLGARSIESKFEWRFPSGATIRFSHMENEDDRFNWDGAQIPYIGFDQLEHFTKAQFFYMFSRNRSTSGVRPCVRFTCNPKPKHFLREMLRWYIGPDGYADESRAGMIRYFLMRDDDLKWADDPEELRAAFGTACRSFAFIPSKLDDNPVLMQKNPEYEASLLALPRVEQERLRKGNWDVDYSAGDYFQRGWFETVDVAPRFDRVVRYWDRAASTREGASYTAGVKLGKRDGVFYVVHVERFRGRPMEVETRIKNIAEQDGRDCAVWLEGDPGQAGKFETDYYVRALAGYRVHVNTVRESKGTRSLPLSAQAQGGNVKIVRGDWNESYLTELENFDGSDDCVSDQTDATSGAFAAMTLKPVRKPFLFTT